MRRWIALAALASIAGAWMVGARAASRAQKTLAAAEAIEPSCGSRALRTSSAAGDGLEDAHRAARGLFVQGLLDLAGWCSENELYLERDNLYRQVIALDPDNLDARKGLRFARNPDGSWKEPAPRAASNRNDHALARLPAQRGIAMRPYCDALLAYVERTHADAALKQRVIDEVSSLDPDSKKLHVAFGDVEVDGKWMTPESAAGGKRRAEIAALVAASRSAVAAPRPASDTSGPRGPSRKWKVALETPHVRVLGDLPEPECVALASTAELASAVVHGILDCPIDFAGKYTIYAFANEEDKDAFVAKLAEFTLEGRALMLSRPIVGLDGTDDLLLGGADAHKRLDGAARYMIARVLHRAFGLAEREAWLADGFGSYVTRAIVGTRSTWFILGSAAKDQAAFAAKLGLPTANWLAEAAKLFQGDKPVRLESVVVLDVRSMRVEDMVCGHALAAFLIEGHAGELAPLMKAIGAGGLSPEILQKTFGWTMDEMRTRLLRWLREQR